MASMAHCLGLDPPSLMAANTALQATTVLINGKSDSFAQHSTNKRPTEISKILV